MNGEGGNGYSFRNMSPVEVRGIAELIAATADLGITDISFENEKIWKLSFIERLPFIE